MCPDSNVDHFQAVRREMVDAQLQKRGIRSQRVLEVMARVPRHEYVADQYRGQAYEDHPIPIGEGQTISQPFIVARMLEALELKPGDIVLEIGTGSGYQTALLAELAHFVYSVERSPLLAQNAESALLRLGHHNTKVMIGDGSEGLLGKSPFDAIIVSAAAPHIPKALTDQLREDGRMVIPVGPSQYQELQSIHKKNGQTEITQLEACRFVPLIGQHGYAEKW